ncbi:hypothetical protein H0H81_001375 [Sphagnurus paluster]|uniref:Uncharacterized protein n=1 Tax=Sphagnurus paluster TaxID=117069 RepID=A0A9P7GG32_9AGAR|nr:hypothetical protein H0H81_001375 [Sphagnurus paluster]
MSTSKVWCLTIDEDYKPHGSPFEIVLESEARIAHLTKKVKEEVSPTAPSNMFVVWRPKPKVPVELQKKRNSEDVDDLSDPYERLKRTKLVAVSPSRIASPSAYMALQNDSDERILDGRPSLDEDIAPIVLLYHGFGIFLDIFDGQKDVAGLDKVDGKKVKKAVDEFVERMCCLYESVDEREEQGLESIHRIFQARYGTQIPNPTLAWMGGYVFDGIILCKHGGAGFVARFANDIATSSIPVVEATAHAAQTHVSYMEPLE